MNKTRKTLAFGAATFFALTACGPPSAASDQESSKKPPTIADDLANLRYPIEETELSINERYTLHYAEDLLMEDCMEAAGYDWNPIEPPRQFFSADSRRYGIMDLPAAVNYGYHLPPPPQEAADRIVRDNELTPAERRIAFGADNRSGCYEKAHKEITGPKPEVDLKLFNTLNRKSLHESKQDPAVKQTVEAWSQCMKRSGYTYSNPFEAAGDPAWSKEKTANEKEREAAAADVKCKQKVDLITTWASAEIRLQKDYIRQNADYFSHLASSKRERLQNMQKVLHGNS
ncbi:hypothetical protein [Streptomyces sp. F001]|uniref:hypothetical protein n=1 Tax=Streptomyces sp. F001 TaxID=1510026 RepID=UPI00101E44FB|nr:hypothetical protein [Streptomyces sp. F001]